MDLEELNEEYKYFTNRLKKMTREAKELSEKAETLADDKILAQGKVVMAKRNGDKDAEKAALEEIQKLEKEIIEAKEGAEKRKEKVKYLQEKVNEKLKDIRKNPEARKIINKAIEERYKGKLEKLNKDREQLLEEREEEEKKKIEQKIAVITDIKEALAKNPDLAEALEYAMKKGSERSRLIAELNETGLSPIRAMEINKILLPENEESLNNNLEKMQKIVDDKKLKIDLRQLVKLLKDAEVDVDGNIKVNETLEKRKEKLKEEAKKELSKEEKSIDRKIARIDKEIEKYESIIELGKDNEGNHGHDSEDKGKDKKDDKNNNPNNNTRNNGQENSGKNNGALIKINWWKNFKSWFVQKVWKRTPEPTPAPTPTTNQNQDQENRSNNEGGNVDPVQEAREEQKRFQESLRYSIMKDAVNAEATERVERINGNKEERSNDDGAR